MTMKISQSLRRLQWRARRLFSRPADNAPIVSVEPAGPAAAAPAAKSPPQPPPKRGWRFMLARILWLALAFVVTLMLLTAAYLWFVAQESRVAVTLEAAQTGDASAAGTSALRAAIATLEEAAAPPNALVQQDMLLAPTSRRARLAALYDGAADAVARYLETLQIAGGRREQTLSDARFALAEGGAGRAAARTALIQLNDRAARGLYRPDAAASAGDALVSSAGAAAMIESDALTQAAGRQSRRPEAERVFFRARGAALAWRRILNGWVQDAPSPRLTTQRAAALAPALESLALAASFQPTLLGNAAPDSSFQPNHLSHLALLMARSAWQLQAAQAVL
jgi:hypothetical protein